MRKTAVISSCMLTAVISSRTLTHRHHAFLYNSPAKVENGSDRERGKQPSFLVVHLHTGIMHFCTTHLLKSGMDQTGNEENSSHIASCMLTHKHNALLYNSPPKFENGLDRERGKQQSFLVVHSHTGIMHFSTTHLLKLWMDWTENEENTAVISSRTLTHRHRALLYNSPSKVENGSDREWEKQQSFLVVCSHTGIMHFCTTHPLKLRMDQTGNEENSSHFKSYAHTQASFTSVQLTS